MIPARVVVAPADASAAAKAAALAEALALPIGPLDAPLVLKVSLDGLSLDGDVEGGRASLVLDYDRGQDARRVQQRSNRSPLRRALGARPGRRIIDATAGLGRDAMELAAWGADVIAIERSPVVHALLVDGLARATSPAAVAAAGRIDARRADALELLPTLTADAVLLDPMFAVQRTAAPKKGMQLVASLTDDDPVDEARLLAAARAVAKRVVVKRPAKGPPLAGKAPSRSVEGRAIRFDVYDSRARAADD